VLAYRLRTIRSVIAGTAFDVPLGTPGGSPAAVQSANAGDWHFCVTQTEMKNGALFACISFSWHVYRF
jgi:hypothetical protein